jgi:hypothetical protein
MIGARLRAAPIFGPAGFVCWLRNWVSMGFLAMYRNGVEATWLVLSSREQVLTALPAAATAHARRERANRRQKIGQPPRLAVAAMDGLAKRSDPIPR